MMSAASARGTLLTDDGGHFFRADFQVHTPRDPQWSGYRPTNLAGRRQWATDLVSAARVRGLHAIAISDHHDFANFPLVRAAAAAEVDAAGQPVPERERLVVFPALELTLEVPCQAILVLDADFPEENLRDVLTALHLPAVPDDKPKCPAAQVIPGTGDINQLHADLDEHPFLKGRYILLPNVTPGGHKSIIEKGYHTKYGAMRSVGGYLDGSIDVLERDRGKATILRGGDPQWGSKSVALFQTSDTREADFGRLGTAASWIKWAKPTAEALRQACLAKESRILQEEPALPSTWISHVVVSQSKFLGRLDLALNPQYTALIGGRGTGKSTVLDYLRWALCDQPTATTDSEEVANPRARRARLIASTLAPMNGHVEVHCVLNGIPHVVRREATTGDVQLKVGEGEFTEVSEADIHSLLPVHAYSQKQLSSIAIRKDELERFVTSPIGAKLDEITRQDAEISGRLRENYGALQRHRALTMDIRRSELRLASLRDQAEALRTGLAGLSEDDRRVLDAKRGHDEARAAAHAWIERLIQTQDTLNAAIAATSTARMATAPPLGPEYLLPQLNGVRTAVLDALASVETALTSVHEELDRAAAPSGALGTASSTLTSTLDAFDAQYVAVKARSTAHEAQLEQLSELEEQQKTVGTLLERQRRDREALGDPLERHHQLRRELLSARESRTAALSEQCNSLTTASDGLISASLAIGQGFADVATRFKALIAGSRVRTSAIDLFFDQLSSDDKPLVTWELVLGELESLVGLEGDAEIRTQDTPTLSRLGFDIANQKRIIPTLSPDSWLDLSLTPITDQPHLRYRAKEGEYIDFEAASAGQQASALLTALLSQTGMPLIIDQPEDDLDSETVERIVQKIWTAKARRQLVFASHNANLVVNGDADLVVVCAYVEGAEQSAGHVACKGAIDVSRVRRQITTVMEGGERAFRLRKEKYGF